MTMKRTAAILATIILVSAITGCVGGNDVELYYNRNTTIGRELLDLQEAKDKGAISAQEYEKVKKDIMECATIKLECPSDKKEKSSED